MLKVLFIDIDGTIRINNKIDKSILEAFKELKKLQVKVILTTGRNFLHARKLARKLDVYPIVIACNGSLVKRIDNNEIIARGNIPRKLVRQVFAFTSSHGCLLLAHEDNTNYYIRKNDDISTGITGLTVTSKNYDRMLAMKYLFQDQIPTLECVNSSKALYEARRIPNKTYFHDINLKGLTKGHGIIKTLDYLAIDSEETMAIGDSNNDISMAKITSISIAVKTATSELKNASTTVLTEDLGVFLTKLVTSLKEKRNIL